MSGSVSLLVVAGPSRGERFDFRERATAIAGRAEDCHPRIFGDEAKKVVSRHHCLFDINPPDVRVRDFGSLNGTFVNDVEIGRRGPGQSPEEGARLGYFYERDLHHNDVVKLGDTVLLVSVEMPPPVPRNEVSVRCGLCGDELDDADGSRPGQMICASCRSDPGAGIDDLLNQASVSVSGLEWIQGYELIRELGRGGQGRVYLVRDEDSDELVALKLLLAEIAVEPSARDGFLREIANIQALHHRNVVAFRQAGSMGGTFFFTCEYCSGGSVDRLVQQRGAPLGAEEAVAIVLQALDGLAYAHSVFLGPDARGLVHRDIKPANIMLSGSGSSVVAKLGDFGLAKAFDRAGLSGHSMTGSIGGTVSFMARQQLINYKYAKPDVDVWSMAASLYWMITGYTPRHVPDGADPILAVLNQPSVPIRDRNPNIPRRLADVIDAALIDKPRIQIATAIELADALRGAL